MSGSNLLNAIGGGLAIGAAASALLFFLGNIMGVSGIVRRLLCIRVKSYFTTNLWRWAFVVGIGVGAVFAHEFLGVAKPVGQSGNVWLAMAAGYLVGAGVTLGSGCTSGHGVCGIARLSLRSLTATAFFMGAAMLTVFIARHII